MRKPEQGRAGPKPPCRCASGGAAGYRRNLEAALPRVNAAARAAIVKALRLHGYSLPE